MSDRDGVQIGPLTMFSLRRADVVRFYRDVAGFEPDDAGDATWLDGANGKIAVRDATDPQTPAEVRSHAGTVVWLGVSDVRAAFERARSVGSAVGAFQGDFFFARDPDGRVVGFFAQEEGHDHDHEH